MSIHEPYAATKQKFLRHDLRIRPATNTDLEHIITLKFAICQELCPRLIPWYKKHPEALRTEFYGAQKQDSTRRIFYTIDDPDKHIVGCGGLIQKDPVNEPDVGELSDIYLLPPHRGHGLGKTLVKDLITKAQRQKYTSIFLTTRIEFTTAIKLYNHLSFTPTKNTKYKSKNSVAFELTF